MDRRAWKSIFVPSSGRFCNTYAARYGKNRGHFFLCRMTPLFMTLEVPAFLAFRLYPNNAHLDKW
jgi:hypothetical protein